MAVELNRDNFDEEVLKSKRPVIVDFWGPQCGPCLALMPAVDKLEENFGGKIKVCKVNTSENRMLCAKLRVLGLPTFLVFKEGEEITRLIGDNITEKDLVETVNNAATG